MTKNMQVVCLQIVSTLIGISGVIVMSESFNDIPVTDSQVLFVTGAAIAMLALFSFMNLPEQTTDRQSNIANRISRSLRRVSGSKHPAIFKVQVRKPVGLYKDYNIAVIHRPYGNGDICGVVEAKVYDYKFVLRLSGVRQELESPLDDQDEVKRLEDLCVKHVEEHISDHDHE